MVLGAEWPVRRIGRAAVLLAGGPGLLDMDDQGVGRHVPQALIARTDQGGDKTEQIK